MVKLIAAPPESQYFDRVLNLYLATSVFGFDQQRYYQEADQEQYVHLPRSTFTLTSIYDLTILT